MVSATCFRLLWNKQQQCSIVCIKLRMTVTAKQTYLSQPSTLCVYISIKCKANCTAFQTVKMTIHSLCIWKMNSGAPKYFLVCALKEGRVNHQFTLCTLKPRELLSMDIYSCRLDALQSSVEHTERGQTMTHIHKSQVLNPKLDKGNLPTKADLSTHKCAFKIKRK